MKRLYFDYNASAPLRPEAAAAMRAADASPGNPSSVHAEGRAARALVESARLRVLQALDAGDARLVWTSGATEADNLAILGAARSAELRGGPRRLVVSAIEHSAVLGPARRLEEAGWSVARVKPDADGRVDPAALIAAADGSAAIVSCILASNEVGTVQDVAALAGKVDSLVHTDASQVIGRLPFSFRSLGVDLATLSSHKLGGPRGVGALLVRRGAPLEPLVAGGDQEDGLRPGTENVAGIAGFAAALEAAVAEQPAAGARMAAQLERLRRAIPTLWPTARIATPVRGTLPNTLALTVGGVDGRALVLSLDLAGIAASVGSACASGAIEPSHVLLAMGRSERDARATVRLSWSPAATDADVDELLRRLEVALPASAHEA